MSLIESEADNAAATLAPLELVDPDSWPSWLQYMDSVDADSSALVQLRQDLGREVQLERYQVAAAIKVQLKELEQKDTLARVLNELQVCNQPRLVTRYQQKHMRIPVNRLLVLQGSDVCVLHAKGDMKQSQYYAVCHGF